MRHFYQYLREVGTNLLFPRRCPICDQPVRPFGALICQSCQTVPVRVKAPICRTCGKEVPPWQDYCSDCAERAHAYEYGCAVYRYHSVSGSLYRFKYKGRAEYAEYYGRCMAECARVRFGLPDHDGGGMRGGRSDFAMGTHGGRSNSAMGTRGGWSDSATGTSGGRFCPDIIVPVPVSRERLRKRGYNQAGLLADVLGRELGIPVAQDALRRRQNTSVMRGLDAASRRNNLEKAFIGIRNDVESRKVMLVDDIYTTGATIDACANALLGAGAVSVCFVALAIGDDPRMGNGAPWRDEDDQ